MLAMRTRSVTTRTATRQSVTPPKSPSPLRIVFWLALASFFVVGCSGDEGAIGDDDDDASGIDDDDDATGDDDDATGDDDDDDATGDDDDATGDEDADDATGDDDDATGDDDDDDTGAALDPSRGTWRDDFAIRGLTGKAGGRVNTLIDTGDAIYAAGIFDNAGNVSAANIAVFREGAWQALGEGLPGMVNAIAFDSQQRLIAAGAFHWREEGAMNYIARFDGDEWQALPGELDGSIFSLVVRPDGSLIVGGNFTRAGDVETTGLAVYRDGKFEKFRDSTMTPEGVLAVYSILPGPRETVCIGGAFVKIDDVEANNVACHDGTQWQAIGEGLPGTVFDLTRDANGKLWAGGEFVYYLNESDYSAGLAHFVDGEWKEFDGGVDGGLINSVRYINFDAEGHLVIAGQFQSVGHTGSEVAASNIAIHDGETWRGIGGTASTVGVWSPNSHGLYSVILDRDGDLIVGGLFSLAGDAAAMNIARYKDNTWQSIHAESDTDLGLPGTVNAIVSTPSGRVFVGGYFLRASSKELYSVAELKDGTWEPLAIGVDGVVRALAVQIVDGKETLVVGGDLAVPVSESEAIFFLARWDGERWSEVGEPLDGTVHTLHVARDNTLIVGGDFENAGGTKVNRIAQLDENGAWQAMGAGFDERVLAVTESPAGEIVVGGLFNRSGTSATPFLAKWNGRAFEGIGAALDDYVSAVAYVGDTLYVGGSFRNAGNIAIEALARLDGNTWKPVGGGLDIGEEGMALVTRIVPIGDGFIPLGFYAGANGVASRNLIYWDGSAWRGFAETPDDLTQAAVFADGKLMIGGPFTRVGRKPAFAMAVFEALDEVVGE